jgi:chromosome segregation ATPase
VETEATRTEHHLCKQNTHQLELKVVKAEATVATAKSELEKLTDDVEGETKKLADELSDTHETLLRVQDESAGATAAYRDKLETLKTIPSQPDADKVRAADQLTDLERVRAAEQELAALQQRFELSHQENAALKDSLAKLEASLQAVIERGAAELGASAHKATG